MVQEAIYSMMCIVWRALRFKRLSWRYERPILNSNRLLQKEQNVRFSVQFSPFIRKRSRDCRASWRSPLSTSPPLFCKDCARHGEGKEHVESLLPGCLFRPHRSSSCSSVAHAGIVRPKSSRRTRRTESGKLYPRSTTARSKSSCPRAFTLYSARIEFWIPSELVH